MEEALDLSFDRLLMMMMMIDKDPKASLGANIKTHATIINQISIIQPTKGDFTESPILV